MRIYKEIEQEIIEYHHYHHDKNVRLIKFVCDRKGKAAVLVRLVNADGQKQSVLNRFWWDGLSNRWAVEDYMWSPPEKEKDMIDDYIEEDHGW